MQEGSLAKCFDARPRLQLTYGGVQEGYLAKCFDGMLAHVCTLKLPESEPDYATLREFVETAWKGAKFSPCSVANADVDYPL